MKRVICLLVLVVCVAFSLPTYGASKTPGVTDDEVVIGMTCPMSGPAAAWSSMAMGNSAWAKHINDKGGIHGRKIKFVAKDDAYNPSLAIENVT